MSETDDRIAGDPVWELFPAHPGGLDARAHRRRIWAAAGLVAAGVAYWSPSAAVVVACVGASAPDVLDGRRLARSIPDKAGGRICSLFAYAWGAWKLGIVAFASLFAVVIAFAISRPKGAPPPGAPPPGVMAAGLLWMGGFLASAALTALGVVKAYRSGMRIWVGEGINQARTLLMGMLMVAFIGVVLLPWCFWLAARAPRAADADEEVWPMLVTLGAIFLVGPVVLLITLDWVSRHVVADTPGKFGPKVPAVGKWNA